MAKLGPTPSQTVGPYFSMCLVVPGANALVEAPESRKIRVVGAVYDTDRKPMDDALLEVWQADSEGVYHHPSDLRAATRCEAKRAVLPRAAEEGDSRALPLLKPLLARSGCGFLGIKDCYPCLHQDRELSDAIAAIEGRQR